jgi:Mn-dependent transcriptional regulator
MGAGCTFATLDSVVKGESSPDVSHAVGDYLKAIWSLSREGRASTNAIAEQLGYTPASVSGMLVRLGELGLVQHVRYRGATLTEAGEREALRLLRRHRLVETFMMRSLGYGWDEVHEEAEALEHVVSDRFAERLALLLGNPSHDPHGDPIPRLDGSLPDTPDEPLLELPEGATLRVARLRSQDPRVLTELAAFGVTPGAMLHIVTTRSEDAEMHVDVDGEARRLPRDLAAVVRGERVS